MASQDFNSAKDRLEQAHNETRWLLGILDDPTTHMGEYNLTPEEQKFLLLESQRKLVQIHMDIGKSLSQIGVIPPWPDEEVEELVAKLSTTEAAPVITPWPDKEDKEDGEDKPEQPDAHATQ